MKSSLAGISANMEFNLSNCKINLYLEDGIKDKMNKAARDLLSVSCSY